MRPVSLPFLICACVAVSACTPTRTSVAPVPSRDPTATFTRFRQREAEIHSLRARFVATTAHEGAERTVQGVLLVRKPDRFRLRLVLPFGVTVYDYLSIGENVWTVAPFADPVAADLTPFSRRDLGAAFLRGADAFPGECAAASGARGVEVTCRTCARCPAARTLLLASETGDVLEEVGYHDGTPRMLFEYGAYREVSERMLPFRIRLRDPERGVTVEIRIQKYEVNLDLADELFRPARGAPSRSGTTR